MINHDNVWLISVLTCVNVSKYPYSTTFFPTCQVRVVRFYHSCSPLPPPSPPSPSSPSPRRPPPSPPPPLPPLPRPLPPCQLFANLFANFCGSGHCWTSTAGCRSEWARLDLNRKVLSAVGTAGRQPGTFRAQWAPLDLNLGPSELSGHRWTSTAR